MKDLGKVRISYKGGIQDATLRDDQTVLLDDGTVIKISDTVYEKLCVNLRKANAKTKPETKAIVPHRSAEQSSDTMKTVDTFQSYDDTAERKYKRGRIIKIIIGVIVAIALCVGAFLILAQRFPEIVGLVPNSYKVAVANADIKAGETISTDNVGFVEMTREEYSSQCTEMYMTGEGKMETDSPIFYLNANNDIVGNYAAEDIPAGSVIKKSMVTNEKYTGQVTVGGKTQNVEMTESQLNGETRVEIIARITTDDGNVQEVPLSSMKLQGKTLMDLYNGNGTSLLDKIVDSSSGK